MAADSLPPLPRRNLLQLLAASFPALALKRRAAIQDGTSLDRAGLLALGAAVLPAELGEAGVSRVVGAFVRWLDGYRPGAELLHGYGTAEIRRTGPSPAARWAAQIQELDAGARQRHRTGFASLEPVRRRGLVAAALASDHLERLPAVAEARHVAVGLLAFFYLSPEAADLCYGARIGRFGCRPLVQASERPRRL